MLDVAELDKLFYLDAETPNGIRWRVKNSRKINVGDLAGGQNGNGYYMTSINRIRILNHRIIFSLSNNYNLTISDIVDHIDRNIHNNNPNNLRLSNKVLNGRNKIKKQNCISTYKGVSFNKLKDKWTSSIKLDRKSIWLGYHETEIDAAMAYNNYISTNNLECYILNEITQ